MPNPQARSGKAQEAFRLPRLPRINVELLEPRTLLAAHAFELHPEFSFDGPTSLPPAAHVEPYFHEAQLAAHESTGSSDQMPSDSAVVGIPLLIETVQEHADRIEIAMFETVVEWPTPQPTGTGPQDAQPSMQHAVDPASNPGTASVDEVKPQSIESADTPSQGQMNGSYQGEVGIVVGTMSSEKGVIVELLVRPDGEVNLPPDLTLLTRHQTLPPAGTPVQTAQSQTALPAIEPALPVAPLQPTTSAAASSAAASGPVAAPTPVLTPLAMTPTGINAAQVESSSSANVTPQVVTVAVSHPGIAPTPTPSDGFHPMSHPLAAIAAVVPSVLASKPIEMAASNAVQLATGAIQPTAMVIAKAGELIADPLPQNSLPAAVAYNFIRFDAAVFHDAVSLFAADLAAMKGDGINAGHSNTRAWVITGIVLGCDAVFLSYWYRKSKREKQPIARLAAAQ